MSINIEGQPITNIPIGTQYELIKGESPAGVRTLKEIEDRVNEFAARLVEHHCKTKGKDKKCVKVQPFKIKEKGQRGNGINFSDDSEQQAQLRDLENWMAPAVQVVNFLQQ